jgi:hypothetical protein
MVTPYLYILLIAASMVILVIINTVLTINFFTAVITAHLNMCLITGLMVGFCFKNDVSTIYLFITITTARLAWKRQGHGNYHEQ